MHRIPATALLAALLALAPTAVRAAAPSAAGAVAGDTVPAHALRAHIRFLADDLLEGRDPGTRGGEMAAHYIATQFERAGLQPLQGRRYQPVPLVGTTVEPASAVLSFTAADVPDPVVAGYPDEAVVWPGARAPAASTGEGGAGADRPGSPTEVGGELVFVGYGIRAPEWDWDDYGDQDVRGRILLILAGEPPAPPEEPGLFDGRALTYYGRWTYKLEEARRRGAAGALLVHRTDAAGYGWDVVASSWSGEQLTLQATSEAEPLALNGWVSAPLVRRVLALRGRDLDELYVLAARRDFRPFRTGLTAHARMESRSRGFTSPNVLGLLPGRHPERAREVVVFTAHYDHLGIGAPDETGDSIYNGAYDNASGVALLLELAAAFARLEEGTERSLLFLATTAEEAGLLGAERYVANPPIPLARTVAALNIDGVNLWGETDDAIVLGGEDSPLDPLLREAAADLGLTLRPDPAPHAGTFFRSDHFPFARAGVPALYVQHGLNFRGRPPSWGEERVDAYLRERYHQPGDELAPDMDLSGAVQQGRLLFGLGYRIANGRLPEER